MVPGLSTWRMMVRSLVLLAIVSSCSTTSTSLNVEETDHDVGSTCLLPTGSTVISSSRSWSASISCTLSGNRYLLQVIDMRGGFGTLVAGEGSLFRESWSNRIVGTIPADAVLLRVSDNLTAVGFEAGRLTAVSGDTDSLILFYIVNCRVVGLDQGVNWRFEVFASDGEIIQEDNVNELPSSIISNYTFESFPTDTFAAEEC